MMARSSGPSTHACRFPGCGKRFRRSYNVRVHMRVHTGVLPFVCPNRECAKRFKWRSTLRTHYLYDHDAELPTSERCRADIEDRSEEEFADQSKGEEFDASSEQDGEETDDRFYITFVFREGTIPETVRELNRLHKCEKSGCDWYFNTLVDLRIHLSEHEDDVA
mmetsp:Transcript_9103/g.27391  ORF Transcript_9103/g.27391 Transcript_9103/m.27391 type:complete len:164 (-) Transcript_9103:135-626(-)